MAPPWPTRVRVALLQGMLPFLVAGLAAPVLAAPPAVEPSTSPRAPAAGQERPGVAIVLPADQHPADEDPVPLIAEASRLREAGRHREAIVLLRLAVDAAGRTGREPDRLQALADLASSAYNAGNAEEARVVALEALEAARRLDDRSSVGRVALLLSILDDARADAAGARTWAALAVEAYTASGLKAERLQAELQRVRVGALAAADETDALRRIAAEATAIGETRTAARALHALGDREFNAGRLDAAYTSLTRVAQLFEDLGDLVALGTAYNSLGRVYRAHGRLDEALATQLRALALHERTDDTYARMQSLNAVGAVYQRLGDLPRAREYTRRALDLSEASGSARATDVLAANYAALLLEEGEVADAARVLEEVIARGRDPFVAIRHNQLAEAYLRMGRLDAALVSVGVAVEACADTAPDQCILAHAVRAAIHTRRGEAAAALADLNIALARLEALRARLVPADFFRQRFHQLYASVFDRAIALQASQASATLALETAERARARGLLDLLASRAIAGSSAAPSPGHDEAPLTLVERADAPVDAAPALTMRGATDTGASPTPSVTRASPATTDDLVAAARRLGSTMLVYWVSDDGVHVWVVTPGGHVAHRRVPVLRARLAALVQQTSTPPTLAVPPGGAREAAWRELHGHLIAPVATALPATSGALLTIVPHGPLHGLSFAALQDARGRYLLESYTLHYVPAGALLAHTAGRRRRDARTGPMLVVADPVPPRRSALDVPLIRLPGARREAAAISAHRRASGSIVLTGSNATELRMRTSSGEPAVLHFATHAIVRHDDPFASYLALGATGTTPEQDGLLTAAEVYGMPVQADLVVLSGCRTAGGLVAGDGVATFARAFLSAGAATVVASMWDVADDPAPRLLPQFHERWQAGASKAEALRAAQLDLLRALRAGRVRAETPLGAVVLPEHPVFWAGFVVFGEPD